MSFNPMLPADHRARGRFRDEWGANFAVSANAGSGKTTAISERLATMALARDAGEILPRTAVVTFTRKAAAQIGQRARSVLVRRLAEDPRPGLAPLDHLERAFFGTIHSFCLLLAQRHGQAIGLNLNPEVVEGDDRHEALWEEFLEQDPMQFSSLAPTQLEAFLRHMPLESVFALSRQLDRATAERLTRSAPPGGPPEPAAAALAEIMAATSRGKGAEALGRNQAHLREWCRRFREETGYLPIAKPEGKAANIESLCARLYGPLKTWLAEAGAVIAAELALRFRAWRFGRGIQTYADQVEGALAILQDPALLDRIRQDGWRIILDEAQDTDPQQFAVLVEVAREPGTVLGTWPDGGGPGPRPGHFSMVGDGQQSIYGSRADVRNFQRHLDAFARGDGGELLKFDVTFRSPRRLIEVLNRTLPAAFGPGREYNCGEPVAEGAPPRVLQVAYEPLVPAAESPPGEVRALAISATPDENVEPRLACELRTIAAWLREHGPAGVGATHWGEVCLLAPRNDWLATARKELDAAGLKSALQMRRTRSGDNPPYAWLAGLLSALCDPEDRFEWIGVWREIFAISDEVIAAEMRRGVWHWDDSAGLAPPLDRAVAVLRPFVARIDAEGETLGAFAHDLAAAAGLHEKAAAIDPGGAYTQELERLLAEAVELSGQGAGPREWRAELLAGLQSGRPVGRAAEDAINLLTAQSAKGLEWPVVIPIGLWREIRKPEDRGLQLVGTGGTAKPYLDGASLPEATKAARDREWRREQVRLLYVALTRARRMLVLPLGEKPEIGSFLDYWGAELSSVPHLVAGPLSAFDHVPQVAGDETPVWPESGSIRFPTRLLPHQLAAQLPDLIRQERHEAGADEPRIASTADPLEYGTWWHETMEFVPWGANVAEIGRFLEARQKAAHAAGFLARAETEIGRLTESETWRELVSGNWQILTEVSVVAPLSDGLTWVDGIIDLIALDPVRREVLVVDWKTNQLVGSAEEFLARLQREYAGQVEAYRTSLKGFFQGYQVRVALYATGAGRWIRW